MTDRVSEYHQACVDADLTENDTGLCRVVALETVNKNEEPVLRELCLGVQDSGLSY